MNNTALAIIQPTELQTIQETGKLLALSGYFDGKGNTPQAIAMMATKIMAGREIGIGPFASVNGIHIIGGKPAIGANLMASAVKGSGRYDYRVLELTEKTCRIEYRQRYGDKWEVIGVSEFTAEDARRAGTKNMDKYPKNMLFARAMSNGVRFYTPDIFSGNAVYIPEELGADVDADGNVVEVVPRVIEQPAPAPQRPPVQAEPEPEPDNPVDGDVIFLPEPQPPTAEELATIKQWANRTEAEMWAVMVGACENEFEAKNSLNKVLARHGGKVTKDNVQTIYVEFLRRQQEKLAEQPQPA